MVYKCNITYKKNLKKAEYLNILTYFKGFCWPVNEVCALCQMKHFLWVSYLESKCYLLSENRLPVLRKIIKESLCSALSTQ